MCHPCRNAVEADRQRRKRDWPKEDYDNAMQRQGGACSLCGDVPDESLHADHCHTSGLKRALLCRRCNVGLGLFKDNTTTTIKATLYLMRYRIQHGSELNDAIDAGTAYCAENLLKALE